MGGVMLTVQLRIATVDAMKGASGSESLGAGPA